MVEITCVSGVGQPCAYALVQLAPEIRQKLASSRDSVQAELKRLLDEVNATLEPHETLGFVAVVRETWTMENGLLTPTMKIKRSLIEKRYEPRLSDWMQSKQKVVWE